VKRDSRGRSKPTYGYSVHTGVDENDFIHRQTVTPGQGHDSQERDTLLLGTESQLYNDAPYSPKETRETLARFSVTNCVQRKG
jgi:IS5 family transposase|tara:strand:- start:158 stop:406 length:249 start_codon:yes stop_codon:yes gene_type:complete